MPPPLLPWALDLPTALQGLTAGTGRGKGRGHPAQVTCLAFCDSLPRWSERRSALRKSSESRRRKTERKSRGLKRDHWAPPTPPHPPPLIYSLVINVFSAFFNCAHPDSKRQTALPASCGLNVGGGAGGWVDEVGDQPASQPCPPWRASCILSRTRCSHSCCHIASDKPLTALRLVNWVSLIAKSLTRVTAGTGRTRT